MTTDNLIICDHANNVGVPEQWRSTIGEAHSYDNYRKMTAEEDIIAPYLIPELESSVKGEGSKHNDHEEFSGLIITRPTEFTHHIHVDYDPEKGFLGLPDAWKEILDKGVNTGAITITDVMNNKEDAARIAGVCILRFSSLLQLCLCCQLYAMENQIVNTTIVH